MRNGWIKLHRRLLDNPICCKDADYLAVWIYLLLEATHQPRDKLFDGKRITLRPGQLITGRKVIASALNIGESKVRRILQAFENDQQIDRLRGAKGSLISVLSWDNYQENDQQNDQQVTSKRPASDQQVTTLQEYKEGKEYQENTASDFSSEFETIWRQYPRKQGKKTALAAYIKARQQGTSFEDVKRGVDAYRDYIRGRKVPEKFIKQGGTFFSQAAWEDDWSGSGAEPEKGGVLDGIL